MKKLMVIAAAMTIAAGAYASSCAPEEQECSLVYKVKMTLKASRPKSAKAKSKTCLPATCYRKPANVALQGYAVICDECDCEAFKAMTWTLWSKKEKAIYMEDEAVEWDFLNIIGKKATELEGGFFIENDAFAGYATGFGKLQSKSCYPGSMSGYLAGFGGVPGCNAGDYCSPDLSCTWAYDCEDYCGGDYDTTEGQDSDLPTAYTGKWSMKFSKSESKKYTAGTWQVEDKVPDYGWFESCVDFVVDDGSDGSDTNAPPNP